MSVTPEIFVAERRFKVIHGDPQKISECPGLKFAGERILARPRDSRIWEPLNIGVTNCPNRGYCGAEMMFGETAGYGVIFGKCPK